MLIDITFADGMFAALLLIFRHVQLRSHKYNTTENETQRYCVWMNQPDFSKSGKSEKK